MMFWVKNHMVQRDVPVGHHMTYHVIYGVQMTKNRPNTAPSHASQPSRNKMMYDFSKLHVYKKEGG